MNLSFSQNPRPSYPANEIKKYHPWQGITHIKVPELPGNVLIEFKSSPDSYSNCGRYHLKAEGKDDIGVEVIQYRKERVVSSYYPYKEGWEWKKTIMNQSDAIIKPFQSKYEEVIFAQKYDVVFTYKNGVQAILHIEQDGFSLETKGGERGY